MIDNTDINTLNADTIMIDNENQAEFILKKLNEDVTVTNTMKEALSLYEKMLKENEMKFGIGDKVKVVPFIETMLDAPIKTIGDVGEVSAIDLDQGDYLYCVTFQNDPEGWNYKENQLEIVKGERN